MGDSPDTFDDEAGEGEAAPTAAELEAAGQPAMFGGDPEPAPAPPAPPPPVAAAPAQPYRVLARKYRPQTFSQLIGQDAMVQTLANGIKRERLAHAFLMTGVRGGVLGKVLQRIIRRSSRPPMGAISQSHTTQPI